MINIHRFRGQKTWLILLLSHISERRSPIFALVFHHKISDESLCKLSLSVIKESGDRLCEIALPPLPFHFPPPLLHSISLFRFRRSYSTRNSSNCTSRLLVVAPVDCYQSLPLDGCEVYLDDSSEEMSGGIGGGASPYHNVGAGAQPNVVSHAFLIRFLVCYFT